MFTSDFRTMKTGRTAAVSARSVANDHMSRAYHELGHAPLRSRTPDKYQSCSRSARISATDLELGQREYRKAPAIQKSGSNRRSVP